MGLNEFVRGIGVRQVRITCGLVMFSYLLSHFTNHALGNISFAAMEQGLKYHLAFWRYPPISVVLYLAALVHASLGLWALYQRRHFHWKVPEITQLALGLSIPALMLQHLVSMRFQFILFGRQPLYPHAFNFYWISRPDMLVVQCIGFVVVWTHACIGLFFWLRMRNFYKRVAPLLLAGAVLLPTLALLGVYQGGRAWTEMVKSPEIAKQKLAPLPTAAQSQSIGELKSYSMIAYLGLLLLVFAARGVRERQRGMIHLSYPNGRRVEVPRGYSVLEASLRFKIPHASVCGGRARCSTCRIRIVGDCSALPPPSRRESFVLSRVGIGGSPSVRLACQLRPSCDIALIPMLPSNTSVSWLRAEGQHRTSEERYVACMFVDMRGSTKLAEKRLAFDTVFIVNRFLGTVSEAVTDAGGLPNQFVGDGLLALFGLSVDRETACRQAVRAAALIGGKVDELNALLAEDLSEPLTFGIGIHAGKVIIGDIGYHDHFVFTALGDPVNVTARLQDMTKGLNCEVVISAEVCKAGGLPTDALPTLQVEIRGRSASMTVFTATKARDLSAIALS
jgi:adenylate cyclase